MTDCRYYIYIGEINDTGYELVYKAINSEPDPDDDRNNTAFLTLITNGGSANAAYKIARAFQSNFAEFIVHVPTRCKSAGTIIAIGSNQLVIGDSGELGPLDVQLENEENLYSRSSGLDTSTSLKVLAEKMSNTFQQVISGTSLYGRIGTRAAAELATRMATELVTPISQQIDPGKLGQESRALDTARMYGNMLINPSTTENRNINPENIDMLIDKYPSHDYVIDRMQANDLFHRVNQDDVMINHNDRLQFIEDKLRNGDIPYWQWTTIASGPSYVNPPYFNFDEKLIGENSKGDIT